MSLIRNIINRSNGAVHHHQFGGSQSLLRQFSTQSQQPNPLEQQQRLNQDRVIQGILRQPTTQGGVYGRLYGLGIGKLTTKNDVISLFENSNLSHGDLKVQYNNMLLPDNMVLQFSSHDAYINAAKEINKKSEPRSGRYRLEKIDPSQWGGESFDGRVVLIHGVPRNALPEDIERIFSGCGFNASFLNFISRYPVRLALVQFPSQLDAVNAVLQKNKSFCLNTQISMRVLQ